MTTHRRTSPEFRAAAIGIAHAIAAGGVWSEGMCAFHGSASPDSLQDPPRIRSLGGDVYEGSAGIARFLALAASVSGDRHLADAAIGATRHALATTDGWSLLAGRLGVGLVATEVGRHLDVEDLVQSGRACIDRAARDAADAGAPFDLLVGTAGVIVGLTGALEDDDDGSWRRIAVALGHSLLAAAVPEGPDGPDGPPLSWPLAPESDMRLCGLAHGAAGVALAMDTLAALGADEERWRSAARRGRAYERAFYSAEHGSWADLRPSEPGFPGIPGHRSYPHMWCHGSVGIAWDRLAAPRDDLLARADAVGALAGARSMADRLLDTPLGPAASDEVNASLCHGVAGLIDLFAEASLLTGAAVWSATAAALGDVLLDDARSGHIRSGIRGGWPTPGLMLGDAGAGWALLRIAEQGRVPCGWRVGGWSGPERPSHGASPA